MKPNADSLTSGGSIELGSTSSGRVFQSFRCWPLVPMPDFLPLRLALEQDVKRHRIRLSTRGSPPCGR